MNGKHKISVFDPGPSGRFAAKILRETNVPGAVIGRIAVWYWVPDPSEHAHTKDLDLAIKQQDMVWIRKALTGMSTRELSIGGINVKADDVNVDFIDRSNPQWGDLSSLFSEAVYAAHAKGATVDIGGETLFVTPPEYIATMKIATGESDDEEDAGRLLSLTPGIDIKQIRDLVSKHLGPVGIGRLEVLLRKEGHPLALPKRRY